MGGHLVQSSAKSRSNTAFKASCLGLVQLDARMEPLWATCSSTLILKLVFLYTNLKHCLSLFCTSVKDLPQFSGNFLTPIERMLLSHLELSLGSQPRPVSSTTPQRTCAPSPHPSWWPLLASFKFFSIFLVLGLQSWIHYSMCDQVSKGEVSLFSVYWQSSWWYNRVCFILDTVGLKFLNRSLSESSSTTSGFKPFPDWGSEFLKYLNFICIHCH